MNEEIRCITNKGKTTKNEWENDSDFLPALSGWPAVFEMKIHERFKNISRT